MIKTATSGFKIIQMHSGPGFIGVALLKFIKEGQISIILLHICNETVFFVKS